MSYEEREPLSYNTKETNPLSSLHYDNYYYLSFSLSIKPPIGLYSGGEWKPKAV